MPISRKPFLVKDLSKAERRWLARTTRACIGNWLSLPSVHAEELVEREILVAVDTAFAHAKQKAAGK